MTVDASDETEDFIRNVLVMPNKLGIRFQQAGLRKVVPVCSGFDFRDDLEK